MIYITSITWKAMYIAKGSQCPQNPQSNVVWFGFVLCCLMTPGLSKDSVSCMAILFLKLQITRTDITPHIKWAVSLVIAYGHFNLPHGFVRVM